MDDKKLPQVDTTEAAITPQLEVGAEVKAKTGELGAEEKTEETTPKVKRTYTEDEWATREAAKDKEVAILRQNLSQIYMQSQIQEATRLENEAATKDKLAVEQGLMTTEDANDREQLRREKVNVYIAGQRLKAEQEEIAKSKVAQHIAKEYGISPDELLADDNIRAPVDMIKKASSLAQKRLSNRLEQLEAELKKLKEGEPQFDSGQSGTTGALVDNMTAEEKVAFGLKQKPKK